MKRNIVLSLISSEKAQIIYFHSTKRFIDDLCSINYRGECEQSLSLRLNIMTIMLVSQVWTLPSKGKHLPIIYLTKYFPFPFSIVRIPHIDSNNPQNIFCYAIKAEFLIIARSTPCLNDFITISNESLKRMQMQGSKGNKTDNSLKKIILAHPQNFQQFSIYYENLVNMLSTNSK